MGLLANIVKKAAFSLLASSVISFIYWIYGVIAGKDNKFLVPFIAGAIGIFIGLTIISIITTIANMIRMKRDPIFKEMFLNVGISWREYKKHKNY